MTGFIVYKHTSPSGKVYIGITQRSPSKRFRNGAGYKDNEHFWRAIEKYEWQNFKHEILYSGLSKEIACKIEIELIAKYNSADRKYGYNIEFGGEHSVPSEETRKKMSEAKKNLGPEWRKKLSDAHRCKTFSEEWLRKISESLKGHVVSEETRRKMSDAHKGHIIPEETRRKLQANAPKRAVMCVETGVIYESAYDAERKVGINKSHIGSVCRNERKTAGGFHWKYYEESER